MCECFRLQGEGKKIVADEGMRVEIGESLVPIITFLSNLLLVLLEYAYLFFLDISTQSHVFFFFSVVWTI